MRKVAGNRWVVLGAVTAVVLDVGATAYGDTPDTRAPGPVIAHYFVVHREAVLAGATLSVVGWILVLAVMSSLAATIRHTSGDFAAGVLAGAGNVAVALSIGATHLPLAGLAYVVAERDPALAPGFFEFTLTAAPVTAVPLAVCALVTALAGRRGRAGRRWYARVSAVAAAGYAALGAAWAAAGPLSPDVAQQISLTITVLWILLSGWGMPHSPATAHLLLDHDPQREPAGPHR